MKHRQISDKHVEVLREVRAQRHSYVAFVQLNPDVFGKDVVGEARHLRCLHSLVTVPVVTANIKNGVSKVAKHFTDSWQKDIDTLCRTLSGTCTDFSLCRASLLRRHDLVADMVGNKKLDSIGVVARSLRQQLKLIDRLHGDGHGVLLPLDYVKHAHSRATLGEETVTFTVLLQKLTKDLPSLLPQGQQALATAVERIRKELAPTGVALTEEMDQALDMWAKGEQPLFPSSLLLAAPVVVPAPATEAVPAPVAAPAPSAMGSPAPPAVPDVPAAVVAGPTSSRSLSLVERVKAKRQRLSD